jgi:hypothetical protein
MSCESTHVGALCCVHVVQGVTTAAVCSWDGRKGNSLSHITNFLSAMLLHGLMSLPVSVYCWGQSFEMLDYFPEPSSNNT